MVTIRDRWRVVVVLVAVASIAVGCSSDGSDDTGAPGPIEAGSTTTAEPVASAPESFTGPVDEFYEVPDPLPAGEPGELIRTMPTDRGDGEGLRIMYHSTDAEGDDRAVTGIVDLPSGEAPDGGWPIVAWAHGTSGLGSTCAPSRGGSAPPAFGVDGIRVATDYIGLGPVGELHPYLSAAAEANAIIDSVVAARSLGGADAGDRWVVAGVSQGGHAALVTGERAAERLPDVELVGTVAMAPGAQLGRTFGDDLQARVITTMVLAGVAAEDPDVDVADYLGPEAMAAYPVVEDGCVADIIDALVPLAASPDYFTVDPRTVEVGEDWLAENDPGQVASDTPLLVLQGDADIVVVPKRTEGLVEQLCDVGQVTQVVVVPGADHDSVVAKGERQAEAWIADRFAGEDPVDDC